MTEQLFMGIDGGGTGLRIAITDSALNVERSMVFSAANPNIIGQDAAKQHVQDTIARTLKTSGLSPDDITAVAIGISGASNEHSRDWLIDTLKPVFPVGLLVPSSDLEIALVGAFAQRNGILVLSGTGSAVLGMAPDGQRLRIGGWGYLLGDAGSACWIGMQALRQITEHHDLALTDRPTDSLTDLDRRMLGHLALGNPRDLVAWLYRNRQPVAAKVADLARLVMQRAECGDFQAITILQLASQELAAQTQLLRKQLSYANAPIAFAGGLLNHGNYLSVDLARRLGLCEIPVAKYNPAVGAALLARMEWQRANSR